MKYIDAEKLIAEIDRLGDVLNDPICQRDALGPDWVNGGKKMLKEIRSYIESLQQEQPSLPSNIDEAAEEWCKTNNKGIALSADKKSHYLAEGMEAFKAGAEWMSGQLQKIEGNLVDWYSTSDGKDYCCGIETDEAFEVPEGFYIRKK